MRRIAYLGPKGTFSEQAAVKFAGEEQVELFPCKSLYEVCLEVAKGTSTQGVLPLENLLEGSVNPVLDLLLDFPAINIQAELMLPVAHNLVAHSGSSLDDIKIVLSHPQALAQCRVYLNSQLPNAKQVPVESTALAAEQVAKGNQAMAAIGPLATAANNGLQVLESNIQDQPNNCTRFVIVGLNTEPYRDVPYKTSLVVSMIDRPGALYSILKELAWHGLNLTRIESRPAKTYLGEYIFYIDLEGHRQQPEVKEALKKVASQCRKIRILGCYPASSLSNCLADNKVEESLELLRSSIDIVDRQIIELIGQRMQLVKKVGKYKQTPDRVRDTAREEQVLARMEKLASHYGVSEDLVKSIYRTLMDYFVSIQQKQLAGQD